MLCLLSSGLAIEPSSASRGKKRLYSGLDDGPIELVSAVVGIIVVPSLPSSFLFRRDDMQSMIASFGGMLQFLFIMQPPKNDTVVLYREAVLNSLTERSY